MTPSSDDVSVARSHRAQLRLRFSELGFDADGHRCEAHVHHHPRIAQTYPDNYEKHVHPVTRQALFSKTTSEEDHCAQ
jgi:hypothetical protein